MKPTIYFIPGLGVDERVFYMLDIIGANRHFCKIVRPLKNESLKSYAQRMIEDNDIKENSIIVGLSFGGLLAAEINDLIPCKKVIILSSLKTKYERPFWMTLQPVLPIKFIPPIAFKTMAVIASPFVGKMSYEEFDVYLSMINNTDDYYYKWAVQQIINWDRKAYTDNLIHIHGRNDLLFPNRFIKNQIVIQGGAHTLVLRYAEQVSDIINKEIANCYETRKGAA